MVLVLTALPSYNISLIAIVLDLTAVPSCSTPLSTTVPVLTAVLSCYLDAGASRCEDRRAGMALYDDFLSVERMCNSFQQNPPPPFQVLTPSCVVSYFRSNIVSSFWLVSSVAVLLQFFSSVCSLYPPPLPNFYLSFSRVFPSCPFRSVLSS